MTEPRPVYYVMLPFQPAPVVIEGQLIAEPWRVELAENEVDLVDLLEGHATGLWSPELLDMLLEAFAHAPGDTPD